MQGWVSPPGDHEPTGHRPQASAGLLPPVQLKATGSRAPHICKADVRYQLVCLMAPEHS